MNRNRLYKMYQSIWRVLIRIILLFVGKLEILGKDNLPENGPYLVVVNHLSMADAPLVLMALPHQRLRVFAADKWRRNPVLGPILTLVGAIFVRRGEVDRRALREAIGVLRDGQVLGLAPEGTRSRSGHLQKARQGAAYIASRARVPLVPIGLANTDLFIQNLRHLRRSHFQLKIGKPFELPDLGPRPKTKEMNAYTELIMGHIAALLPEHYRGYYADSPVLAAIQQEKDPWPAACRVAGIEQD